MTKELLERIKRKAMKSQCKHRLSAIGLNKRGEVLCTCFNTPRFSKYHGSVHAEMQVMNKAGKALRTILLCRVNLSGKLLCIDPCSTCASKARELGVKIISVSGR